MKKAFSILVVAACIAFTASAAMPVRRLSHTPSPAMASSKTGFLKKGEAKLRHKKHRMRHKHAGTAKTPAPAAN